MTGFVFSGGVKISHENSWNKQFAKAYSGTVEEMIDVRDA